MYKRKLFFGLTLSRAIAEKECPREDDLRRRIPRAPCMIIFLKSINSFAPCCESYFYFLLIEAPTSVSSPVVSLVSYKILSAADGSARGDGKHPPRLATTNKGDKRDDWGRVSSDITLLELADQSSSVLKIECFS